MEVKIKFFKIFCEQKNIQHNFSPYHLQTNIIVELSLKEISKKLVILYPDNSEDNLELKNTLHGVIEMHNNIIHSKNLFKLFD